jgi:cell division GTPase FtsZ
MESGHKISQDEFSGVPDIIDSRISDDAEVFHGSRVTDKPNYYKLEAIYVAG